MTTNTGHSLLFRATAWALLLTFATATLTTAQTTTPTSETESPLADSSEVVAAGNAPDPCLRSRRPLTAADVAALAGQTLELSVRNRWPPRVVQGELVGVRGDEVEVQVDGQLKSLPLTKTVVVSQLPGDFAELVGQKVQLGVERWSRPIVGRVVTVDATHVTVDTVEEVKRYSISTTMIISRTPDRDRRRVALATIATMAGVFVAAAIKCR